MRVIGLIFLVYRRSEDKMILMKNILALHRSKAGFHGTSLNGYIRGEEKFEDLQYHPMKLRLEQWFAGNDHPEKYECV